jgi:ATP-dependent RNA helicase RhlE
VPFRAFGFEACILKAVEQAGYTEPTPIQSAAIPPILAGHDVIGIAQTGTGKTAAFVLPILAKLAEVGRGGSPPPQPEPGTTSRPAPPRRGEGPRRTRALIVAPTRELAVQIEQNIRAYGRHLPLRVTTICGGVSERPQIEALRSGMDLLVATPGRLLDLMGRGLCDFSQLSFAVLDEADRMLDMGFLPDIRRIVKALPSRRQTLLFCATLSREIEAITREFLRAPKTIQIGRRADPAATVTQLVYEVPKHLKPALLAHLLRQPSLNMVLVFSRMKHGADRLAHSLAANGIRTATLHSNRSQNQRLRALKDFKSGAVRVLVATDIAARGIDVEGISHVVNYDFPMHPEDYVHRIGRTGRARAVGDAISFVTPEDHSALRSLERFIGRGIVRKRSEGFNYAAAAPAGPPRGHGPPHSSGSESRARPAAPRPPGAGYDGRRPFRPAPARLRHRWRR